MAAGSLTTRSDSLADAPPPPLGVLFFLEKGTLDYVRSHSSMQGFLDEGVLEVSMRLFDTWFVCCVIHNSQ